MMVLFSESILPSSYSLNIYEKMSEESMEEIMRKFKELHPDFD